jgi:hypothetical protein
MTSTRLSRCGGEVPVLFDDASVFDERQVMTARGILRLATPDAGLKPDGLGTPGDGLVDVSHHRIRPAKDHHHVDGSSEVPEAREAREACDRGSIRTHRNDVVARLAKIRDRHVAVACPARACADDGDGAGRPEQTFNHSFFATAVFHDRV